MPGRLGGPVSGDDDDPPWFIRPLEEKEPEARPALSPGLNPDLETIAADWRAAEAQLVRPIADASLLLGRLAERQALGASADRLRCREVSDLMWRVGHPVRVERLALYDLDGGVVRGARAESYALAHWTLRRLRGAPDLTSIEGLRDWLGWGPRQGVVPDELTAVIDVPSGAEVEAALARWLALARALEGCTGLTRGAALAFHWGHDPAFGRARESTAMMIGALIAGEGALPFAPVAIGAGRSGGPRVTAVGQGAEADLTAWVAATHSATERALLDLNAQALWRERAGAVAATIRGRVAGEMVDALAGQVALSASMASALIGCTPESAERALVKLEGAGLAREITGGRRWRFWCARV